MTSGTVERTSGRARLAATLRDLGVPLPGGTCYDVAGKVVVITGGADGIGFALARILHDERAVVALVDVDGAALAAAERALGGRRVLTAVADVRDRAAMDAAVREIATEAGGIDVIVANAGVTPPPATLRQIDPADFDRVVDINLTGAFNTVRPAIDEVIARRGHVVVVSSAAAFSPALGGAAYVLSKAAVEQLGRILRLELAGHGATAGVAYFGIVDTRLARSTLDEDELGAELNSRLPWPLRRRITPQRAARSVARGIARRAGSTTVPRSWQPWGLLRGLLNVLIDGQLVTDRRSHAFIRDLEARTDRQAANSPADSGKPS
ncbi:MULTISPECIES: short-chain dehydrogenase/reductase [unclassified Saccharopolyspora]|uniref:short-chain dehydrogenase/reductase n=2 Tax=Pseudonocardiaceae TaxID=2070 RepID=UPI00190CAEB4|nr:short-chain dehydrogenase/reductase [Saccharopolyspora sp. HNM0986]MBK0869049.1 SDR family NAD(P)-dependent oxidoreductase [Saccharopolyspora sp. HNM0986]